MGRPDGKELPVLAEVASGVLVHQSALLENNAVVVQGADGVLLVDPGLTDAELTCLADDLRARGLRVVAGFATHPDWDHALWHADLGDAPRYGTARCAAYLRELRASEDWQARFVEGLPPEIAGEVPVDLFGDVTGLPDGATELPWDGPRVRVLEHRGHAPGHAALLLEASRVLVAGDMLSDVLVPMLDDADEADVAAGRDVVAEYLAGLDLLESVADEVDVVVPGHGAVGDAADLRSRIALDRAYLTAQREGRDPHDPRIESPRAGWEWVADVFGPSDDVSPGS